MTILKTENEGYGFYRAMHLDACADEAWAITLPAIVEATGADPEHVRAFLDSSWGRHFADDVHNFLSDMPLDRAVAAAITRWNGWNLSLRTRKEHGIPTPMPYLSGMVYAAAMYAEVI